MMSLERESTGGGAVLVDPLGGLVLDPSNELKFKGPFDDYVTVSLVIKNPTEKRIAFKIKTTAPKRYCVKPNSGVLDQGQSMKVNVLLQPFNYDPNEKNKHKFMVQYMYLNDEEMQLNVNDILNMWKDVPPTRLLDLKLKCIFEYTEAEQQKLAQQQQQQQQNAILDSTVTTNSTSSSSSNKLAQQTTNSSPTNTQAKQIDSKTTTTTTRSSHHEDFDSARSSLSTNPTVVNTSSNLNYNHNNNTNTNTSNSSLGTTTTTSTAAAAAAAPSASKIDKSDNILNELKLLRQKCESLEKENSRLKEEEARLRKLALQAPSSLSAGSLGRANPNGGTVELLVDLLNNKSTIIIITLIAIIIYLLLFR